MKRPGQRYSDRLQPGRPSKFPWAVIVALGLILAGGAVAWFLASSGPSATASTAVTGQLVPILNDKNGAKVEITETARWNQYGEKAVLVVVHGRDGARPGKLRVLSTEPWKDPLVSTRPSFEMAGSGFDIFEVHDRMHEGDKVVDLRGSTVRYNAPDGMTYEAFLSIDPY